ncbi:MAG: hypothetical protein U0457_14840 [Candidatus Sericytochromatia bacterium]
MVYFPKQYSVQPVIVDPLRTQQEKVANQPIAKEQQPVVQKDPVAEKEKIQKFVQSIAKEQVGAKNFKELLSGLIASAEKSGIEPEELIANKDIIKKFLPSVGEYLDKVEAKYNEQNKGKSQIEKIDLDFKNGELRFHTDGGVKVAKYEKHEIKLEDTKYQKFIGDIKKQKVELNGLSKEDLLKNIFTIAEANGIKAEDLLKQRGNIIKIFPKTADDLENLNTNYENLNKNAKPEDKTQISFKDGELVFKTGQDKKILNANGELVADPNNTPTDKTVSSINLKEAKVSTQYTSKDGFGSGGYADIDDMSFGGNISDTDFGSKFDVNMRKGSVYQEVRVDKTTAKVYSDKTGYSELSLAQDKVGSLSYSGGGNKATTLSAQSDKLGGVQFQKGKYQQTVIGATAKIDGQTYGANVRTGNAQGTQVSANLGKAGSFDVKVSSKGVKFGGTVNGSGGSIDISRSNDVVSQTVKNGVFTTEIKDDNQTELTARHKVFNAMTIGISAKKGKSDSRSFSTSNVDPKFATIDKLNTELAALEMEKKKITDQSTPKTITPEDKTKLETLDKQIEAKKQELKTEKEKVYPEEKLSSLIEAKKKILETPKIDRTPEQISKLAELDKQIKETEDLIKTEKETLKPVGNNVQEMTENIMSIPDGKKSKKAGWEYAATIPQGDKYTIQRSRTLSFGGEVSLTEKFPDFLKKEKRDGVIKDYKKDPSKWAENPKSMVKVSDKHTTDVDVNLSVEGLGDSKVKVSVSRKLDNENEFEFESQDNILSGEQTIKKQKSQSYELEIDLKTPEGQKLYQEIMDSASKFCEELPIPQEGNGVKIISNKDETSRDKEGEKGLEIPGVTKVSISKETDSKTVVQTNYGETSYEMEGSGSREISQSSKKLPVIGKLFSDETKIAQGNYTITPSKEKQIETLESIKDKIKSDQTLKQEEKTTKIKEIESKIAVLEKELADEKDKVSQIKVKKDELTSFSALSDNDKKSKLATFDQEIATLEAKNKPLIDDKTKQITDLSAQIEELGKDVTGSNKTKIEELTAKKSKLEEEITTLNKPIADLRAKKDELVKFDKMPQTEKEKFLASLDAQVTDLESSKKATFKISLKDEKTTRGEVKRMDRLKDAVTNEDYEKVKGKKFNDRSAVSMDIELVADEATIDKIIKTDKETFIKAAADLKNIPRFGNGIRRLEHRFKKAEEEATKEADVKKYPNPSEERTQLIKAAQLDVMMKFVARNGKDGIAVFQKVTGGDLQIKSTNVNFEGYKAENLYAGSKLDNNTEKATKILSDDEVTGKEARSARKMRREVSRRLDDAETKLKKIEANPMLTTDQKEKLKTDLTEKVKKLEGLKTKLDEIVKKRDEELYGEEFIEDNTDFEYDVDW